MKLKLVVLRCADIEISKKFYEKLGMRFQREQHGNGPVHYASEHDNFVFELYPDQKSESDNTRLGLEIDDIKSILSNIDITSVYESNGAKVRITSDPDGRKLELYEKKS